MAHFLKKRSTTRSRHTERRSGLMSQQVVVVVVSVYLRNVMGAVIFTFQHKILSHVEAKQVLQLLQQWLWLGW